MLSPTQFTFKENDMLSDIGEDFFYEYTFGKKKGLVVDNRTGGILDSRSVVGPILDAAEYQLYQTMMANRPFYPTLIECCVCHYKVQWTFTIYDGGVDKLYEFCNVCYNRLLDDLLLRDIPKHFHLRAG